MWSLTVAIQKSLENSFQYGSLREALGNMATSLVEGMRDTSLSPLYIVPVDKLLVYEWVAATPLTKISINHSFTVLMDRR
jgi:hypothetical protein